MKGGPQKLYVPPGRRNLTDPNTVSESKNDDVSSTLPIKDEEKVVSNVVNAENSSQVDKKPRNERAMYVPPGRRNVPQQKVEENNHSSPFAGNEIEEDEWKPSRNTEKSDFQSSFNSTETEDRTNYEDKEKESTYIAPSWTELDHEFKDYIDNEKLDTCCLVIDNYPSTSSDLSRENEIQPYLKYGCEYKWISRQMCLMVFLNESQATKAINCNSSSYHHPVLLEKSSYRSNDIYRVARDLHSRIKPERDSKVANRLINHALGIRAPKAKPKPAFMQKVETAEEPPVMDAWDD